MALESMSRAEIRDLVRLEFWRRTVSARELAALRLVAEGLTDAEVGRRLYIARSTAKQYLGRVMVKFGACSRAHAVALGYETGLLVRGGLPVPGEPGALGDGDGF